MTNKKGKFRAAVICHILAKRQTFSQIDRNVPITFSRTWRISDSERMGSLWLAKITFLIERTLVTSD